MQPWQKTIAALALGQGVPSRFRGYLPHWVRGDGRGGLSIQAQTWCSVLDDGRNTWKGNLFEAYAPGGFPPGWEAGLVLGTEVRGYLSASDVQELLDLLQARLPEDAAIRLEHE